MEENQLKRMQKNRKIPGYKFGIKLVNGVKFQTRRRFADYLGKYIHLQLKCNICKEYMSNMKLHLVAHSRNSDLGHIQQLVKVYPQYKPKLNEYIKRHELSLMQLNLVKDKLKEEFSDKE